MSKYNTKTPPVSNVANLFGAGALEIDGYRHAVILLKRPSIVNIYAVSTTDATWTKVPAAVTLSNVLTWRLSERNGNDFRYAFVAAPATYMTAFGMIQRDTEITAVYVQRIDNDVTVELECWSYQ